MGVVGLWSLVFPDLRDIDRFEDVMVDSGSPVTVPLIADREASPSTTSSPEPSELEPACAGWRRSTIARSDWPRLCSSMPPEAETPIEGDPDDV